MSKFSDWNSITFMNEYKECLRKARAELASRPDLVFKSGLLEKAPAEELPVVKQLIHMDLAFTDLLARYHDSLVEHLKHLQSQIDLVGSQLRNSGPE